ncbi:MAG: amidohydrolase family protein [Pseudomonadota bacterium]
MNRLVALLLLWTLASCKTPTEDPTALAITNVTVIDAVHGRRDAQTVVFRDDHIVAVQPTSGAPPNASRIIDGTGRYLIPGLWDFHVHLTYTDELTAAMPELFLRYGITSVRDTGGTLGKLLPVVEGMRAADARAPRVFFSGPLLDGTRVVYDGVGRELLGTAIGSTDDARQTVAALKRAGADFIKIYELVSPEVFQALVDAARDLGMPIESHVPLVMLARDAGPMVDGIQHLRNIELDCAADAEALLEERRRFAEREKTMSGFDLRSAVREKQILPAIANYDPQRCEETMAALRGTLQGPTLRLNAYGLSPPYTRPDWESALSLVPEPLQSQWREFGERQLANPRERDLRGAHFSLFLTGEMFRRGVPFAAGTDTPIGFAVPGYSLHRELELLVESGLTPLQALGAATLEPAKFFGLEQEMGSITVDQKADLVLLTADPQVSIGNTKQIAMVIAKGRVVFEAEP